MTETKEIRCINKKGAIRYISEHLTRDAEYMVQMGLEVAGPEAASEHFSSFKASGLDKEDNDDSFSTVSKEKQDGPEKENTGNKTETKVK